MSANGNYGQTKLNSSFIGGPPADSPRLLIATVIHGPHQSLGHYGGVVSARAAGKVLERSLAYLQVKSSPHLPPPPPALAGVRVNYNEKAYTARTASASE